MNCSHFQFWLPVTERTHPFLSSTSLWLFLMLELLFIDDSLLGNYYCKPYLILDSFSLRLMYCFMCDSALLLGPSVCRMNSAVVAVLVPFLLLWAPASVQGRSIGAPIEACTTFTPQHDVSSQLSDPPYTLFVSGLLLEGNQTCYVPDQMYTSEFVYMHMYMCTYVVGQCNDYSLHNRMMTIITFSFCCSYTELVRLRYITIPRISNDG